MFAKVGRLSLWVLMVGALSVSCVSSSPPSGEPDGGADGGTLPDGGAGPGCGADGCPFYLSCNQATGTCEPTLHCTTNEVQCTIALSACVDASCAACTSDSQCDAAHPRCETERGFGCVQCLSNTDCDAASPICTLGYCMACDDTDLPCPSGQTCVQGACSTPCDDASDCPSERPECELVGMLTRYCTECSEATDCGDGLTCQLGVCRPYPSGGSCKDPTPLVLVEGRGVADGQFAQAYWGAGWYSPPEAHYQFQVTAESLLEITTATETTSSYSMIDVFAEDPCNPLRQIGESRYGDLKDFHLSPGTYYLRLRFQVGAAQRWRMTLALTPVTQAHGTSCTKPIPLAIGAAGTLDEDTASLDPAVLRAQPEDPCDSPAGDLPDALLAFELQERKNVVLTATPSDPADSLQPELSAACYPMYDQYCIDSPAGERVSYHSLNAGPHSLRVRNVQGPSTIHARSGPFQTNASCGWATDLTFVGGVAVAEGHTDFLETSEIGGCDGSVPMKTAFFLLDTTGQGARSLQLRVISADRPPQLFVDRPSCSNGTSEAARYCLGGSTKYWDVAQLAEGRHHLEISEAGAFKVEVTLGDPYPLVSGDTCSGSTSLQPQEDGTFTATSDTRGARDHFAPTCGGISTTHAGKDLTFDLLTYNRGRAQFTITPGDATFDPVVTLTDSTCAAGGACFDQAGAGQPETLDVRFDSVQDFIVDGADGSQGPFTIAGVWTPAPTNDECQDATALAFDSTVTGSVSSAFPDPGLGCTAPLDGPDMFYTFTAPSNGTATVTLTPVGFDAGLSASTAWFCSAAECISTVNANGPDGTETLSFPVSRNQEYYVTVHGTPDASGTFNLSLAGP